MLDEDSRLPDRSRDLEDDLTIGAGLEEVERCEASRFGRSEGKLMAEVL